MTTLAIQPGAIGDFILSLPALRWLRRRSGAGGLEVWAGRANLPLVDHPEWADRVRPLAETGLDSYPMPSRTLDALRDFDMVVSWRGAGLPELAAAVSAVQPRVYFLPQFPPVERPVHLSEFRRAQLSALFGAECGVEFSEVPEIPVTPSDEDFAREYLSRDLAGGRPLVVLHPGASGGRKQWGVAEFAALAAHLAARWGARIILSEGPLDTEAVEGVIASAPGLGARRMFVENLRRLAAVLRCCHLFAGNDTGITHLAVAAGLATVAIFQSTDPRIWAPRGRLVRVLEKPSPAEAAAAADTMLEITRKGTHAHAG